MARYEEFLVDQGSTFRYELTLYANHGGRFDLDGYSITSQIRTTHSSGTIALTPSVTKNTSGVITFELTDEQTALLTEKRYVYDIYIEGPDLKKYRVLEGNIVVSPRVTQ